MSTFLDTFLKIVAAWSPFLVALVGIIPTMISNRKKTQESIRESSAAMKASNDAVQKQMAEMKMALDNHIREDEDDKARTQRYRILRFYDEMCERRKHSESHFEDILDDIDAYEQYCFTHPDFKNSRGQVAMKAIKDRYAIIKANGGFLTHDTQEE